MIITPQSTSSAPGREKLAGLRERFRLADAGCRQAVAEILEKVRTGGDEALVRYIREYDAPDFDAGRLRVSEAEIDRACSEVDEGLLETLRLAVERIRDFHLRELEESWTIEGEEGTITGRLVRPVASAGLYVPGGRGGKTPLVSSVLMNAIPAMIAGVERRVMVTPPNAQGEVNAALLVAAREAGLSEIYKAGSAWAIAALAYGTETVPRVDVIVGPGNQYVTEAKRQVAGMVRIDMIAGPSEVLIIADSSAEPAFIAADMLAQAEHDPQALAMLVSTSDDIAGRVAVELERQLALLSRSEIAGKSLRERGVILVADSLTEAVSLANRIAPEHLELMVAEPWELLAGIRHAGAIFLGAYSPEAAGDYLAGPNHVLPTMGTARFSSALGVETFLKKSSIISYSRKALEQDAAHIVRMAELEGLTAHARSVEVRLKGQVKG